MTATAWYRRPADTVLVVGFLAFCFTSATFDRAAGLDLVAPDSPDLFGRLLWHYGHKWDPLVAANPLTLRIMSAISAFLFGPFYLVAAWAFVNQRNWIRTPALIYGSAMLYSMLVHVLAEFMYEVPLPSVPVFVLSYGAYAGVPALLLWRIRDQPFPADDEIQEMADLMDR